MRSRQSILKNMQQLPMNAITTTLTCLHPLLDTSTYRQLRVISQALLVMTDRITMLNISRWTEQGGSYRTVQRFFLWGPLQSMVNKIPCVGVGHIAGHLLSSLLEQKEGQEKKKEKKGWPNYSRYLPTHKPLPSIAW